VTAVRFPRAVPIVALVSRRRSVVALARRLAVRFPQFDRSIGWRDVEEICQREHIAIRVRSLPPGEKGWLVRVDSYVTIRLSRLLTKQEKLWTAVHELCHYFSDDPGEMCRYAADSHEQSDTEEFCERFAWYCVDPGAREFLQRWREEAF
jgi:hypothetical protein